MNLNLTKILGGYYNIEHYSTLMLHPCCQPINYTQYTDKHTMIFNGKPYTREKICTQYTACSLAGYHPLFVPMLFLVKTSPRFVFTDCDTGMCLHSSNPRGWLVWVQLYSTSTLPLGCNTFTHILAKQDDGNFLDPLDFLVLSIFLGA